jgi:hypothetical protein
MESVNDLKFCSQIGQDLHQMKHYFKSRSHVKKPQFSPFSNFSQSDCLFCSQISEISFNPFPLVDFAYKYLTKVWQWWQHLGDYFSNTIILPMKRIHSSDKNACILSCITTRMTKGGKFLSWLKLILYLFTHIT